MQCSVCRNGWMGYFYCRRTFTKRFLLGLKSRKFEYLPKDAQRSVHVGLLYAMHFSLFSVEKRKRVYVYNMSRAWADWRCLSLEDGQCESLRLGDKRRVQKSHVFLYHQIIINSRISGFHRHKNHSSYEKNCLFFLSCSDDINSKRSKDRQADGNTSTW